MGEEDGIRLTGTEFKVSATEKVSTGDYENYQPHVTIEGEIEPRDVHIAEDGSVEQVAHGTLTPEARRELKARLLSLHKDAQEIVQRAAENRIAHPDSEDWGVHNGVGGEDEDA